MLEQISRLAREAGEAIMAVYQDDKPLNVEHKSDDSPVTACLLYTSMVMRTKHAVTEASPMVKAKDERRGDRREDFANETADDADAGDSEE